MSQFCIARRLDCNLLEAVAGLLSVTRTAVSAKFADAVSDEVGRILPWLYLHEWGRV
jgi:hypothetical protein